MQPNQRARRRGARGPVVTHTIHVQLTCIPLHPTGTRSHPTLNCALQSLATNHTALHPGADSPASSAAAWLLALSGVARAPSSDGVWDGLSRGRWATGPGRGGASYSKFVQKLSKSYGKVTHFLTHTVDNTKGFSRENGSESRNKFLRTLRPPLSFRRSKLLT